MKRPDPDGRPERGPRMFLSPEQYRAKFGREPVPPEPPRARPGGWGTSPGWSMPWAPPTVVVLMGDWTGTGLWDRSPASDDDYGDDHVLEPEVLGTSPALTARLADWFDRWATGPSAAWRREGRALAEQLQREFDARGLGVEVLFDDGSTPQGAGD